MRQLILAVDHSISASGPSRIPALLLAFLLNGELSKCLSDISWPSFICLLVATKVGVDNLWTAVERGCCCRVRAARPLMQRCIAALPASVAYRICRMGMLCDTA